MFDVNQPQTLDALTKWWDDFRDKAPVPDDRVDEFCVIVVGNKIDVAQSAGAEGARNAVSEAEAREFIQAIVPHPSTPPSPSIDLLPSDAHGYHENSGEELFLEFDQDDPDTPHTLSDSIEIRPQARRGRIASRSHSRSTTFHGSGTISTVTTMHSIYHTPSSSLYDTFESALSSPAFTALTASRSPSASPLRDSAVVPRRMPSTSSMSSAPTITPSLFVRGHAATTTATTPESSCAVRPPPERYPRLFFTSAKTGEGVREVFEYVARRVVTLQEYEEALEARTMHVQEASVRLSIAPGERPRGIGASCCGS